MIGLAQMIGDSVAVTDEDDSDVKKRIGNGGGN